MSNEQYNSKYNTVQSKVQYSVLILHHQLCFICICSSVRRLVQEPQLPSTINLEGNEASEQTGHLVPPLHQRIHTCTVQGNTHTVIGRPSLGLNHLLALVPAYQSTQQQQLSHAHACNLHPSPPPPTHTPTHPHTQRHKQSGTDMHAKMCMHASSYIPTAMCK